MNKILILVAVLSLCACGGNTAKKTIKVEPEVVDMHTAENALDYHGIYMGTLPAADCPGIETTLMLAADGNYQIDQSYLERDASFSERGRYTVVGNTLTLDLEAGRKSHYKIEENRLRMLDAEKKPIEGELSEYYLLTKIN